MKTNAVRLLERSNVAYELREYEVDITDLSATTVAKKIGLPAEQVFKTLVVTDGHWNIYLAVLPGNTELDLKALAKITGDRKLELTPLKDVQGLTGYMRGGVTALACKKAYPVIVDSSILKWQQIAVSAGARGTQMILQPADYLGATNAQLGSIAKGMSPEL